MRNSLALMLLAGACCLVFSQLANADVNTITEVSYYEPTDSIFAWAEVIPDYDTLAYYCFDDWGEVRKDDVVINTFWGGSCDNESYYEGFFSYDPDADYTIEVHPQLICKFNHPIENGYDDYYDYIQWANGDPVSFPYSFSFTGPGPEGSINTSSIILGAVYSLFTEGGTAGQPDHLKVVNDVSGPYNPNCSTTIKREITFQVVDAAPNHRKAGTVPVKENFVQVSSNSCNNGSPEASPCANTDSGTNGRFTDQISIRACRTGSCGYTITDEWKWCPSSKPSVTLATLTETVHNDYITVNSVTTPNQLSGYIYR